ncbi:hypothetical protein D9M71_825540 [compost metagenome]
MYLRLGGLDLGQYPAIGLVRFTLVDFFAIEPDHHFDGRRLRAIRLRHHLRPGHNLTHRLTIRQIASLKGLYPDKYSIGATLRTVVEDRCHARILWQCQHL